MEIKFASKNVLSLKFMRNSKRNHKIQLRKGQEFMQIELSNAYECMSVCVYVCLHADTLKCSHNVNSFKEMDLNMGIK